MNWVRALVGVLVLWSSTAGCATLPWNANSEPDLAGYRVYRCSQQPCTQSSSYASLLATMGAETNFTIGTPVVTEYYFITAYDFANNESGSSNLMTLTPVASPGPFPPSAECSESDSYGQSSFRSVGCGGFHDRPTGCHGDSVLG